MHQRHGPGEVRIEGVLEGKDADEEQDCCAPDRDLVDPQHELEAIDADHQHQECKERIEGGQYPIRFRQADHSMECA